MSARRGWVNSSAVRARARAATSGRPCARAHRSSCRAAPASADPELPRSRPGATGWRRAARPRGVRGGRRGPSRPRSPRPPAGPAPRSATGRPGRPRPGPSTAVPARGRECSRTGRRSPVSPTRGGPRGPAAPPRPRSGPRRRAGPGSPCGPGRPADPRGRPVPRSGRHPGRTAARRPGRGSAAPRPASAVPPGRVRRAKKGPSGRSAARSGSRSTKCSSTKAIRARAQGDPWSVTRLREDSGPSVLHR